MKILRSSTGRSGSSGALWRFAQIISLASSLILSSVGHAVFAPPFEETSTQFGALGVQARIAQGIPADQSGSFPWMAGLQSQTGDIFCGAVVLDAKHLVTAAHCVAQFSPNQFEVYLGDKGYAVERVWVSHEFRWSRLDRDLAVIRVRQPLAIENGVQVATGLDILRLQDGDPLTVLGFGQTVTNGSLNTQLSKGVVPFVSAQSCADVWRSSFPALADVIVNDNICAGGNGNPVDTCTGDSGGPLLFERNNQWHLLGLTSYGEPQCGGAQKPSVYTNIDAHAESLQKALAGEAYYMNWTQSLVGESGSDTVTMVPITNHTNDVWQMGTLTEQVPYFTVVSQSTCFDRSLFPGETCQLAVAFEPTQGGFFADRLLIPRWQREPLWLDLQGFAFDFLPESRFGSAGVFGFTGGEVFTETSDIVGMSEGGYLYWNTMAGLDTSETYIGSNTTQELDLYFDFLPVNGASQMPTIDVRALSAFGEELAIDLDRTPGWERVRLTLNARDFLYIRIQAPGKGLQGVLKFDLKTVGVEANSGENVEAELPALNQGTAAPRQVMLEAGGSVSFWAIIMSLLLLFRRRSMKDDNFYEQRCSTV